MSDFNSSHIKVAVGATSLITPLTGIGNYTLNLTKLLLDNPLIEMEGFYGYRWSKKLEPLTVRNIGKIKKVVSRLIPYSYASRRIAYQIAFNSGIKKGGFDLYHEPNFLPFEFKGATVITVHDLSYIRHPQAHPKERIRIMSELLPSAIENSQCIIADSHFTKLEICSEFSVPSSKIHVTHLGKSPSFYPRIKSDIPKVLQKYKLNLGQYVIAVGTLEPRKNLIQAIHTYQALPDKLAKRFPLTIVGMRGWKEEGLISDLNILIRQGKAKMLGYVSDHDLPYLYSGARSLIFPSLYEGFGLPILEAMACGTPVVASDSSSIPEVIGDAGILVEVGDVDIMKMSIEKICEDDEAFSRLSSLGITQAKKFSWEKCAEETYSAYQYALAQ